MKNSAAARRRALPTPPDRLSAEAGDWWAKFVAEWDLDDAALLVLGTALEAFDRMKAAQDLVDKQGLLVADRFGQMKLNPAATIERDSRSAMLAALKQLNLDLEPLNDKPGRPPGR